MKILTITAMSLAALAVSGCAMTSAGLKKGDERTFTRSINDVSAGRAIKARMRRAEGFKLSKVDVEVSEGIVVLSGKVNNPEDKIEAERIAWSGPNVQQVGNEILLSADHDFFDKAKDGLVTNNLRARLIAADGVKSINYNIETYNGVVYLLGMARTAEELEKAAHVASTTRGVREVVSYVKVYQGENNLAGSAPTSVAAAPYSGPAYGSAPSTAPMPYSAPSVPTQRALPDALSTAPVVKDPDALGDGEPYLVDPQTGERIVLPEGVKPLPYIPDTPGSLGAGATPPPGLAPGQPMPYTPTAPAQLTDLGDDLGKAFPTDNELGAYRTGRPGEAVSVIESAPFYVDPDTGEEIPVRWNGETFELTR